MSSEMNTTKQPRFRAERANQSLTRRLWGMLLGTILLAFVFTPSLRAQTVNLGGTGALGTFINPTSVMTNTGGQTCGYAVLQMDLAQGKVFAIPNRTTANATCTDQSPVDVTNLVFQFPPTGPITDGVIEVTDFTLQQAFGPSTFIDNVSGFGSNLTHLVFLPNANNTPVWLRATGNVTINSGAILNVAGSSGQNESGFLRGAGGAGGPGAYRGGDGGNGGLSPSVGSTGFGPGGGPGGAAQTTSCTVSNAVPGAKLFSTGKTVAGTAIPAGNDLLTMLRGGSGGGGEGGCSTTAGAGGGGGGGAILIASNDTITVNGQINAEGGNAGCCWGSDGAGGVIRLVAATIAGTGPLNATEGNVGWNSEHGILRLEAFTISYTGSITGGTNVFAASAPGQVFLPTSVTVSAFLKVSKITNSANTAEFRDVTNVPDLLTRQDIAGRTGLITAVDVTMPDLDTLAVSTVNVDFVTGPNTTTTPFPSGKTVTLVVTPLDPAQGAAASYTGAITCPGPGSGDCTASVSSVTLPLGFSSFSAFTVLSISSGGALAQMFPRMIQGEEIENVRIQTDGKGTEYVLIARSGREFPYQPQ